MLYASFASSLFSFEETSISAALLKRGVSPAKEMAGQVKEKINSQNSTTDFLALELSLPVIVSCFLSDQAIWPTLQNMFPRFVYSLTFEILQQI